MSDWRMPYRIEDAGGSAQSASAVGWAWVENEAMRWRLWRGGEVAIETCLDIAANSGVICAYAGTELIAAATIFRDQMNFAVLLRWRRP